MKPKAAILFAFAHPFGSGPGKQEKG